MVRGGILTGCLILLASPSLVFGLCSTCLEERCYDNGECIIGCVPGYVGKYCNKACPSRCLNKACHVHIVSGAITCTDGCEPGYCDIKCTEPCPGDCVTCDRQCGSCNVTLCPERRYGADCGEKCTERYGKCDRETGHCIKCRRGYYGDECTRACTGCFTRADNIRDTCLSGCEICQTEDPCPVGFFGDSCELKCSSGCKNPGGCNRASGECSTGCVRGYDGLTCNNTYCKHCLSGRCNRATGECSDGCVSGYHGPTCNYTCSEYCLSGRCNSATGECSAGCVSGYHGPTCNYTCNSFCEGGLCNQHDGVCTSGCISGYTPNLDTCEKYDNEGFNTTVAIAVPIIILVCLVVGIAVVIWRRRRSRRPNRPRTERVEKGMKGTDVAEPLLKYKKEEAPQQLPEEVQRLKNRTREEIESITAGMIRVSAVEDVLDKLTEGQRWVTITGNAGDGKTTLGYLVLKELLQKNVNVFTVYKPEDYEQIEKMKEDRVIMFDDRFGAFLADQQLIKSWLDVIRRFLSFNEKDQQINHVIFISRKNVVNESKMYLGQYTLKMFDPKCVVDLSVRKVTAERLEILDYHLQHENVTVNHELKKKISKKDMAHGFPHCCKMYSKLRSNGYDVNIEEFFESPLKFLDITTKVLYKDNCKDLFQLMIKNDGMFDVNNVKDEDKRQKLLQVEKEQEGSYITVWRNGTCQFSHPSVYESVLNVINDIDPVKCVQYATLSVIRQKMIIATSDKEDKSRSASFIILKPIPAVLKALAERFREEILKGDYSVFTHRLCRSREFCEALVSCCVTTDEREKCSKRFINQPGHQRRLGKFNEDTMFRIAQGGPGLIDEDTMFRTSPGGRGKSNEDTMLWTAFRSGKIVAVCVLMREGASIQDVHDWYERTPLHYLCQEKDSSADDDYDYYFDEDDHSTDSTADGNQHNVDIDSIRMIITEGRGDVNVCDKYGRTPLHYLSKHQTLPTEAINFMIRDMKSDPNHSDINGSTPLHYFCRREDVTVDLLKPMIFEGKGDLGLCEQHNSTPLHNLCANSSLQLDTVDLVIKEGKGDFNKGDEHGTTPFHYICKNGKCEQDVVFQIVNTANGDINKQDDSGITPLHVLCKGSLPVKNILTLINQGDKTDMYGNTPLHYLCRRRGINAEVLQQQLEQIPETDMKKENVCGYTPLDYLADQDDSLPWTDVMIDRSAADLVLCSFRLGDNWTVVLGRTMILNSERVHELLQVEDFGRVLTNLEQSGHRNSPGQFLELWGTCSSPVPVPPSPSPLTTPPSYWETSSTLTRRKRGWFPLLEMGLKLGRSNMDDGWFFSGLPDSVCVSVTDVCNDHRDRLCIQVMRKDQDDSIDQEASIDQEDSEEHQVGECVSLSLPTPGVELTLTFGLVLDVGRGRVGFIDVERGQLLCKVDLQMKEEVSPMFYVTPNNNCATRMRLISGREICVTDRKIHLIQQVLSD